MAATNGSNGLDYPHHTYTKILGTLYYTAKTLLATKESHQRMQTAQEADQAEQSPVERLSRSQTPGGIDTGSVSEHIVHNDGQAIEQNPAKGVYSKRSPQVFLANDGVANCYALLLSPDLVNQLENNMQLCRKFSDVSTLILAWQYKVRNAERDSLEMRKRLVVIRKTHVDQLRVQGHDRRKIEESIDSITTLMTNSEKTIRDMKTRLERLRAEKQSLSSTNTIAARDFYYSLARPLQKCGLLIDDAQEESQPEFSEEEGETAEAVVDLTGSQLLSAHATNDLHVKRVTLQAVQKEFDAVPERHERDRTAFFAEKARGERDDDVAVVDTEYLNCQREITGVLITAEAEYDKARQNARAIGIRHSKDDRSIFLDASDDGYTFESEAGAMKSVDPEWIHSWMKESEEHDDEHDDEPLVTAPEMDEWDSRSVEISDSNSARAVGRLKTKIDSWHERIERPAPAES